jgi:cyclic-di-AMP phosphodiesterase PgpH
MLRKKIKRVDARLGLEGHMAARRERFFQTGAPLSLVMLAVYTIAVSVVLSLGSHRQVSGSGISWLNFEDFLTMFALLLMFSASLGLYVAAYHPEVVKNHGRGAILLGMLLVMVIAVRTGVYFGMKPYLIVVPVMLTAIITTIAWSQRFALGIGAYVAIISIIALQNNPAYPTESLGILLATACGMGIAVLWLKEIRSRTTLIEVCVLAAVVVFSMVWVMGLWRGQPDGMPRGEWLKQILANSLWGAGGTVCVGFFIQGLLPLIERLFRTATNMTLLDYSEPTKPLLNRLAMEAPGTFNHSLLIGMLAEAAAKSIGANGLLCRVGSYYHDVGKLNKPRYFVENQINMFNQHRELSPTMSRMIIMGHVKDGLELAKVYRIPKVLHQFISTHHGTTLVEYFYREAIKQEEVHNGQAVEETDFRYPGPKPWTKEAAIVMLADAVEGATRAQSEPTPSRIETIVDEIALRRLQDGQFDECDLTMRELKLIKESLLKSLCGMYHGRIAYPKAEKPDRKKFPRKTVNSVGTDTY